MTSITFAPINEQGVNFVAVLVTDETVNFPHDADKAIIGFQFRFRQPVVLLGERNRRWYGRSDIVEFMARVHPSRLPWRRGEIS
jgi:hypothetical protein